jgi:hypothetical protein
MRGEITEARGDAKESEWVVQALRDALDGAGPDYAEPLSPGTAGMAVSTVPEGGVPSHGVLCMWPKCFARDTSRYGVTDPGELLRTDWRERPRDEDAVGLALCPKHANLLAGLIFKRHAPAAA